MNTKYSVNWGRWGSGYISCVLRGGGGGVTDLHFVRSGGASKILKMDQNLSRLNERSLMCTHVVLQK